MSDQVNTRFAPQNQTTNQRLSTNTVGLVALSDFRKRRAEVLEQQERESREAAHSGTSTPDRSQTGTPDNAAGSGDSAAAQLSVVGPAKKKSKKKRALLGKKLLSFGDEEDDEPETDLPAKTKKKMKTQIGEEIASGDAKEDVGGEVAAALGDAPVKSSKFKANTAVGVIPRSVTKAALRKEAEERDALRREFLALQEAVKATEIAIPFVFYDGAHIPGGTVRLKKGDFVWVFLDRCRKVVANRKGEHGHRRGWARAGVDDLMLVRDTVIIPPHFDFYYFIMNKSVGPGGRPLFNFSAEAPKGQNLSSDAAAATEAPPPAPGAEGLSTAATKAAATAALPDINTLEGAADDAKTTKVVDRRWYARNKHIYPASTWQEFDPEKDYVNEIRKDMGGNTFFFTK